MARRVSQGNLDPIVEEAPVVSDDGATQTEPPARKWPELTPEEIQGIKDNNLNHGMPFFQFENAGQVYVFRALSSKEWTTLMKKIIEIDITSPMTLQKQDEMVCDLAVIWPSCEGIESFWERNIAGAAKSLVLQIRKKSGFSLVTDSGLVVADTLKVLPLMPDVEPVPEPLPDQIEAFRNASPNGVVVRAEFPSSGGIHYFRPLTRAEWEQVQAQEERGNDSRDFAVRASLLWSNYDWAGSALAGIVEQLFDAVMDCSGFSAEPTITEL